MELTTEQKARVFAAYIGQEAVPDCPQYTSPKPGRFNAIDIDSTRGDNVNIDTPEGYYLCSPSEAKLLLRPLSAITDEDAIEVAKICHAAYPREGDEFFIERKINSHNPKGFALLRKRYTHAEWPEMNDPIVMSFGCEREFIRARQGVEYFSTMSESFQFLIQRGYAIPLFIAPGHPANGKTAIELGLAIAQD